MTDAVNIRTATMDDLPFMRDLGRRMFDAIGFVPLSRYEKIIQGGGTATLNVAEANGDLVGFIYATHNTIGTKVQQCAVREDARRLQFATALVSSVTFPNDTFVAARCAVDLESNVFWRALGFNELERRDGGTRRGRVIARYTKTVGGLFVPEGSFR